MPTYNEQYVYSVQVTGATAAIAQLRELQQAANQVRSSTGSVGVGGTGTTSNAASSGARDGDAYGRAFSSTVGRAMTNVLVYGAIGVGIGSVVSIMGEWRDANIALSDSLAELQVKLGATQQEAEAYYWTMQQAAFATGQDVQEATYAKTIEQRVNRPGLSEAGLQFGLVFPEVPVQQAVGNLLALQIQFGASFDEINEVLLDTVQASGLTAKELLNLSDTWGPLSQELGMLDAAGKRTSEGMRDISGLMAGMATVMGESGSTIENFLRKMSNFYTDPEIKAFLSQRGIETTAGKTATGLDIRVPFMDLMNQISAQAKIEPGFAVGLQEFFPNQLGQPTQQQLQELIRNWDTINSVILKAGDTAKEWGDAVEVSSQRASVAIERLGVAFSGFFAALGGTDTAVNFINSIAAIFQTGATRISGPQQGYMSANGNIDLYQKQDYNRYLQRLSNDPIELIRNERRLQNILDVFQIPKELTDRRQAANYTFGAVQSFVGSEQYNPEDNGITMAAAFLNYISLNWDETLALKMAQSGSSAIDIAQAQSFTTPNYPDFGAISQSLAEVENASWTASQSIYDMATAADAAFSILGGASLKIPEGVSMEAGFEEYTRRMQFLAGFASSTGLPAGAKIEPTTIWDADGLPVTIRNIDPKIAQESFNAVDKQNKTVEAENKKLIAANEAAANRAEAAAEARAKRLESLFDGMFAAITRPTSVTALDLMYNAPGGKYRDKWDEPVRQMRADVNNLIAGKDLEYNFGGGVFGGIFDPGVLGFAKGADQDTKSSIMKDLQAQAEEAFYGLRLSPEAYTGSKEALIASAQEWVAGKRSEKANRSMMKGWLTEAGLGPEAMGFLDEMDEPPILKMLTGGKTKDEMTTLFSEKIPNVSESLAKGAEDVTWIAIIASTITAQVKEDPDALIGAGQVMGGYLAQGSASAFVMAIVPQIIAAVMAGL